MKNALVGNIKFFIKVRVLGTIRDSVLALLGGAPRRDGSENRILIVNLELIGDCIVFTSVLKHYRAALAGKKIYLLINTASGMTPGLLAPFVDQVIGVHANRFKKNPFYAAGVIRGLRAIGFGMVIDHNPSAVDVSGKAIALGVRARETICYAGFAIDETTPATANMRDTVRYVTRKLIPRFSKVVPRIAGDRPGATRLPNYLEYYAAIFEGATGKYPPDLVPTLTISEESRARARSLLTEHGIVPGLYALFTLGAGATAHKNWGAEKFAELAEIFVERGVPVVLGGSPKERPLADIFKEKFGRACVDLVGKTKLEEAIALVETSLISISNDSAPTHIAVALKKPSLAILGLVHFGRHSLYGYKDRNVWVYDLTQPCLCDNGRCGMTVPENAPSPCIAAVSVSQAKKVLTPVVDRLVECGGHLPDAPFSVSFT